MTSLTTLEAAAAPTDCRLLVADLRLRGLPHERIAAEVLLPVREIDSFAKGSPPRQRQREALDALWLRFVGMAQA